MEKEVLQSLQSIAKELNGLEIFKDASRQAPFLRAGPPAQIVSSVLIDESLQQVIKGLFDVQRIGAIPGDLNAADNLAALSDAGGDKLVALLSTLVRPENVHQKAKEALPTTSEVDALSAAGKTPSSARMQELQKALLTLEQLALMSEAAPTEAQIREYEAAAVSEAHLQTLAKEGVSEADIKQIRAQQHTAAELADLRKRVMTKERVAETKAGMLDQKSRAAIDESLDAAVEEFRSLSKDLPGILKALERVKAMAESVTKKT